MTKEIKINDGIYIKGVDRSKPNCEGRVVEITKDGVYICNVSMPYVGTYTKHFVPNDMIERV